MPKPTARKRISAFITACFTVAAILVCLRFGEEILSVAGKLTGIQFLSFGMYAPPADGELLVRIIDVGQADSTLIQTTDAVILIDAGSEESEATLKAHLDAYKIEGIDYLICTHPHDDHIGGADMVIKEYGVKNLLTTHKFSEEASFKKLLNAAINGDVSVSVPYTGQTFSVGTVNFTVLGPLSEYNDENDTSLIIKLVFGETSFLFTGDASSKVENDLLSYYGEDVLDCDFYKIAHHGANTASCAEFLTAVSPTVAAASSGRNNEFGHPRGEVLSRLEKVGCKTILRTDLSGTMTLQSDGKVLTALSKYVE